MNEAQVFDKAWKLGLKGDFSLSDEIYHSKYWAVHKSIDVEVDIEADKIVISTYSEFVIFVTFRVVFENEE